ncbi:hypothetical protein SODALDRAFT_397125 [Sodiomyces alkalinus F11]|uniref:Uncharacterized protein n=1 Tax=Sodiomyces alkalinus (strain CBS 110278 / VKM F-3762 / F11) TaxID=1314773 RepID=A0A3N2Q3Z2_SODAK|nr:hypothetical protein SODALDRAFT_397125 [Sodiomyces alkalinus F11]ROT41345.1 hypothetical protein SODALDRAFT_397125 [Sodiomyces alkalinus F11]
MTELRWSSSHVTRPCTLSDLSSGGITNEECCVSSYLPTTAILILKHESPHGSDTNVFVQTDLILENITAEHTRVGEWLNVIGYLTAGALGQAPRRDSRDAYVQALLLWPAGPFDIRRYERSLKS